MGSHGSAAPVPAGACVMASSSYRAQACCPCLRRYRPYTIRSGPRGCVVWVLRHNYLSQLLGRFGGMRDALLRSLHEEQFPDQKISTTEAVTAPSPAGVSMPRANSNNGSSDVDGGQQRSSSPAARFAPLDQHRVDEVLAEEEKKEAGRPEYGTSAPQAAWAAAAADEEAGDGSFSLHLSPSLEPSAPAAEAPQASPPTSGGNDDLGEPLLQPRRRPSAH